MRALPRLLLLLGCLRALALAAPLAAQELQVPLDAAGRIERIDLRLAQRLGLFVERYPDFQEARLFQADSGFVLEITTLRQGRTARERQPMSAAEVEVLRQDVTARLAQHAPGAALNQEGRYLLMGQTTLLGLGFYGWALPYLLDAGDTEAGGLYLLTASASFFLPFAVTQRAPVSFGMANLSRYGASRGILHGALLYRLLGGDTDVDFGIDLCDEVEYDCEEATGRGVVAAMLATSAAEAVGGYLWARSERMTAGTANAITTGGDFGTLSGLSAAVLLGVDEQPAMGLMLASTAAGVLAGRRVAARRDYTWGDGTMIYTAGAAGAFAGAALLGAMDVDDDEPVAAALLAGSAAGLYLGDRLVREVDFSVGQSTLNRLGTLAGALAGAGLGVVADDERVAWIGSAGGALLGYGVTYAALAPEARERRGERLTSAWSVRLSPQALLARNLGGAGAGESLPALPLLSVEYRFGGAR